MSSRITWMDTPAAYGADVRTVDGTHFQVVADVYGEREHVRMSFEHDGEWSQLSRVVRPERFGPHDTRKRFRAWVQAFVAAGEEE